MESLPIQKIVSEMITATLACFWPTSECRSTLMHEDGAGLLFRILVVSRYLLAVV